MTLHQIIILSLVQGLTEFLPISSSGHLILIPHLFGWKDQGLLVDVAMHAGTLFAVLTYFHKDAWLITKGFFNLFTGKVDKGGRLFLMLTVATIPAVIAGAALSHFEADFRSIETIAWTTLIFAALLYVADKFGSLKKEIDQITFVRAFLFGLAQALALIPGTSRSGACLTAGRFMGFTRPDAAKFAFLMSIPAILAAAAHTGFKAWKTGESFMNADILLCIGFSALFGFMAISFMMHWLKKSTMTLFVIYRCMLGAFLFWHLYKGL